MRRVCGNYATGVAIVSTMSATDQPVALTVNSFSSVSLDPPLILWSLRSTSPSRRHFEEGKAFASSEERRVGTECVSTCRSRWSPYPSKNKTSKYITTSTTYKSTTKHYQSYIAENRH